VQRRHQKVIEEAPASVLDPQLRAAMGEAAVAIARAVGYVNAGTLEFLVEDGRFYFLEMNTRLQVEHPVTELVSGIDLVREQLRIASGEPLSITQEEIAARAHGHAVEIRVNAEDPAGGRWTPSPGPITLLEPPGGFGVRLDSGYRTGDVVTGLYDGLVAKLVVWAEDRTGALARAARAIREMRVEGVRTSLPAQLLVLEHPDFVADRHDTRWLEDVADLASALPAQEGAARADDDLEPADERAVVTVGGRRFWIPAAGTPAASAGAAPSGPPAALTSRQSRGPGAARGDGVVRSPMQGTVVQVKVEVGQQVSPSDVVCVVEAMKMENAVLAEVHGTVREVAAEPGASVPPGFVLVSIEPEQAP
jgi:acetyl-CoA/propionyl-CoA carboxylase, biotin carboxylase, biotin carboxyl carrier protein